MAWFLTVNFADDMLQGQEVESVCTSERERQEPRRGKGTADKVAVRQSEEQRRHRLGQGTWRGRGSSEGAWKMITQEILERD